MFSVFDNDLCRLMATGRNCKTKEECIEEMKGFLSADHSDEELKNVDEEYLECLCNFEIIEHKKKYKEEEF